MKLNDGDIKLLKLLNQPSPTGYQGWCKLNHRLLPMVRDLPTKLVLILPIGKTYYARLTNAGEQLIDVIDTWLV
jgi:hypothetical protein